MGISLLESDAALYKVWIMNRRYLVTKSIVAFKAFRDFYSKKMVDSSLVGLAIVITAVGQLTIIHQIKAK